MLRRCLAFLLSLALLPALAAAQAPAPQRSKEPKKVWTNEDLEALRNRVRLSSFEGAAPAVPQGGTAAAGDAAPGAPAGPAEQVYKREDDPAWYRQRLTALRSEVERIDSEIRRLRETRGAGTQSSATVGLDAAASGLSPEDQIAALERRRASTEQQITEIEDEARRRGIPPAALR